LLLILLLYWEHQPSLIHNRYDIVISMLKVFFTAATSFNGELHEQYKTLLTHLKKNDIELLSGEQTVNKELLEQDKEISKKEIYAREHSLIDEADLVIAEVSKPSLGVGEEIAYALNKKKPVLALILDPKSLGTEDKLSPMIAGNPSDTLYIEYYNHESLPFAIRKFLSDVEAMKKRRGKLIVIEGGDGAGKNTQAQLLLTELKKRDIPVKYVDFPQYYPSFHGKTVAKFLRGEFGSIDQVSPYLASLAYALDRASIKDQMEEFMASGGIIIANRYATSNMAHQGAKFKNEAERKEYLKWVHELEYKVHRIPQEDCVVYLHVPWEKGMELSAQRGKGEYLQGKEDIHEKDIEYRKEVEKMYSSLAKSSKKWVVIECVQGGKLLPKETIHQHVVAALKQNSIL
jgi:dTMP kinase